MRKNSVPLVRPDQLAEDPIAEPAELKEFLDALVTNFASSNARYLDEEAKFRAGPNEGIPSIIQRYREIAIPLIKHKLETAENLAPRVANHLPAWVKKPTWLKLM